MYLVNKIPTPEKDQENNSEIQLNANIIPCFTHRKTLQKRNDRMFEITEQNASS